MAPDSSPRVGPLLPGDDDAAVLEELNRVLSSTTFQASERSRAMLSFVVTETLAGRGAQLSGQVVGAGSVSAGDGPEDRQDVSVRVRATRLRKALRAFYAAEGARDQVRIDLPAGGYVPTFTVGHAPVEIAGQLETAVLVMVFESAGERADAVASVVTEALVSRLSRFPGLRVLGPTAARSSDARQIGRAMGARYVLQGSVFRQGAGMRLAARVTDATSGQVAWAAADAVAQEPEQLEPLVVGWVAEVAGELGDYAGALLPRAASRSDDGDVEALARLSFYTYILQGTNASLADARTALDEAVAAGSRAPDILAMAANTRAILAWYGLSEDSDADLAEAESLARSALAEDSRGAHAHLALGQVALKRGQREVAIECAREGVRKASGHPTMLATAGVLLCLAGAWDEGIAVTRESLRLNPAHPAYLHGPLAADRIFNGDDAGGLAEAALMTSSDTYHGPFWRAMALAGMGYLERARAEFAAAVAAEPGLAEDPASVVTAYGYLPDKRLTLLMSRVALIRG